MSFEVADRWPETSEEAFGTGPILGLELTSSLGGELAGIEPASVAQEEDGNSRDHRGHCREGQGHAGTRVPSRTSLVIIPIGPQIVRRPGFAQFYASQ